MPDPGRRSFVRRWWDAWGGWQRDLVRAVGELVEGPPPRCAACGWNEPARGEAGEPPNCPRCGGPLRRTGPSSGAISQ